MRRTYNDKAMVYESGSLIGVNLGYDYCAEHEWGIKGLQRDFGIPNLTRRTAGADSRTVTKHPRLAHIWEGDNSYLFTVSAWVRDDEIKVPSDLGGFGDEEWGAAWDGGSWGIWTTDASVTTELYEAIGRKDLMMFLSGTDNPFGGSGLALVIRSRMPQEWMDEARKADLDHLDLWDAFDSTGIEKILEKAGCRYYALRPVWENREKGELRFWLNPQEQQRNNYGWYTLQDLVNWAEGEGPIPVKEDK